MPLFGKSGSETQQLIETTGPLPQGYHVVKILNTEVIASTGIGLQQKVIAEFRKQCKDNNLDGFANLKFTASGEVKTTLFGCADGIKAD
ncbi:hypothetical protein E2I17_06145 [Lactiplantibacillus plantarum]|uniref:hypothetical protein n=1 Tax=Lactiplantibacillus plantarum TaxID=1590 RepID=UPI00081C6A6D|nr:hypothetical protein [Lactiplantibacillus plantarum]AOB19709.1 hypothetical protein AVR82_08760 [Lactiplantibacillus plantarum]AOB23369.1 hypothetical protein AVR83_10575 [Lactiplantibacillus plantarum]QIA84145.1 hypothetical protein FEE41_02355 [Lactiplantibacillus plantarum]QVG75293.1 hypothetical protein G9282_10520 [Lactiplantibacillus plantarum]TDH43645.1 hypothetical protein E2I17_06145 [Lactiplantibacillus plantarum]